MHHKTLALNQVQEDTLTDFLNVGYIEISGRLKKLLKKEVAFQPPSWEFCVRNKVDHFMKAVPQKAVIVEQNFIGKYSGKGFLIFDIEEAKNISSFFFDEERHAHKTDKKLNEDQKDVLKEIGNITINGLICSADNFLNDQHDFHVPTCFIGPPKNILNIYELMTESFPILVMHSQLEVSQMPQEPLRVVIGLVIEKSGIQVLANELENKMTA